MTAAGYAVGCGAVPTSSGYGGERSSQILDVQSKAVAGVEETSEFGAGSVALDTSHSSVLGILCSHSVHCSSQRALGCNQATDEG